MASSNAKFVHSFSQEGTETTVQTSLNATIGKRLPRWTRTMESEPHSTTLRWYAPTVTGCCIGRIFPILLNFVLGFGRERRGRRNSCAIPIFGRACGDATVATNTRTSQGWIGLPGDHDSLLISCLKCGRKKRLPLQLRSDGQYRSIIWRSRVPTKCFPAGVRYGHRTCGCDLCIPVPYHQN